MKYCDPITTELF